MTPSLVTSLLAGCTVLAGAILSSEAADDGTGARLVATCATCHRLDGRSTGIPSILRWESDEIVDKMKDFRSNERANNVMRAVSLSLSDEEILAVADALARLGKTAKSR